MSENFNNFNEKFKVDDLMIVQTEYWRWSLRPLQCTLGAGILSLKRPAETMSELTAEEGKDLVKIIKIITNGLYTPQILRLTCLRKTLSVNT